MTSTSEKKYVLIVPDGAGDRYRRDGLSPLAAARTESMDFLAREGSCGRMRNLHPDLPRGSIVAHLGMLGWDPRIYYPHGRASCELLALEGLELGEGDLAFRANFVRLEGNVLASYNAGMIPSCRARPLIELLDRELGGEFPDFELHHNSDFRNTLVIRGAHIDPRRLHCPEPHEHQGSELDLEDLAEGDGAAARGLARRVNRYLARVRELLADAPANMLLPWSASEALRLPPFAEITGFDGKVAVVAAMDFLCGIARAGGMSFYRTGNGRPDTDYRAKGDKAVERLAAGDSFVICHVNAPDEAAHMNDVAGKIDALEKIDRHVVRPIVEYFERRPAELGGVLLIPDHYTNISDGVNGGRRVEAHSVDPVPFALWDGRNRDGVESFSEDSAARGRYGTLVSHPDLLRILGIAK